MFTLMSRQGIALLVKYCRTKKSLWQVFHFVIFLPHIQDVKHKGQPTQPAFTKTTVTPGTFSMPLQDRRDAGFTSQVMVQLLQLRNDLYFSNSLIIHQG